MYVLSCEPATCAVPEWHKEIFRGHEETVTSNEGWAPGSLNLAQAFATKLRTLLAHGDITRLLVDFSKGPDDPSRFSRFSLMLNEEQRRKLDERHHGAYFKILCQRIAEEQRRSGQALHLSIRTREQEGAATIGLLHDSSRKIEATWVNDFSATIKRLDPARSVSVGTDLDYPLSSALRSEFPENFGSVSLVVAQSCFLSGSPIRWEALKKLLLDSIPKPSI
jgi:predicted N-formylglutamate amidohydrolase